MVVSHAATVHDRDNFDFSGRERYYLLVADRFTIDGHMNLALETQRSRVASPELAFFNHNPQKGILNNLKADVFDG